MRAERGMVLINALVVVLVIAGVAAGLLTRSEAARTRAGSVVTAQQIGFHLDAAEGLIAKLLADAGYKGQVVHDEQAWAADTHLYRIGDGQVRFAIADMQGKLNVNWLAGEDPFAEEAFRRLFAELRLSPGLLEEIRDFLAPQGPRSLPTYLRRDMPVQPRGGPVALLEELRDVRGMDREAFETLSRHVTALPVEDRLNLNTAGLPVLRAVLFPFPSEVRAEVLQPGREGPIEHLKELRDLTIAILETEDLSDLPFRHFTLSSAWFQADIAVELDGRTDMRRAILHRERIDVPEPHVAYRWALRD